MTKKTKFCILASIYKASSNNKWIVFSRWAWLRSVVFTYIPHFDEWIALEKDQE